ncbi:MAG TPA: SHOCT domain-containing protein [Candidatus Dormibacteraeota bacterium]|jgi:hypothetical protein|nr:SHOCT domain-containing protein [Candidatus Dormibacteraeota bacterium]
MIVRRRPLLRAAMVGGVGYTAYQAGKRRTDQAQHEAEQDAQLAAMQQQAEAPVPPPAATPPADAAAQRVEALSKLKELLDAGALTQQEFDAEKRRILRGE